LQNQLFNSTSNHVLLILTTNNHHIISTSNTIHTFYDQKQPVLWLVNKIISNGDKQIQKTF